MGEDRPKSRARPTEKSRSTWLERASSLPESPGVYLMKDGKDAVVYVGKAKNLRARVRSYFQDSSSDVRFFVGQLVGLLHDIETVVTRSEKEALLLEREMIRRHEPRFNIVWRDDKQYLCLRVDTSHEYPWVQVVRQLGNDGARYFGPFHSASAARRTLRVVNRHFRLRTCRDSVLYHRTRPCLEYQIGRCPAPCVFEIDRVAYRESVDHVLMFLEGHARELMGRLEARMWEAAERHEYEVAAHYRDQRLAVERTLEPQEVAFASLRDQDAVGLHRDGDALAVAIVEVRRGRVENVVKHVFSNQASDDRDNLESFLLQRYTTGSKRPPDEILTPMELPSREALGEVLAEQEGEGHRRRVRVLCPKRGDRRSLLALAEKNAVHALGEHAKKAGSLERALIRLKEQLRLRRVPVRIEGYDISNFQGGEIVGSKVVFERGEPRKALYRRYRVKSAVGQDDFGSMYEVILRRMKRGLDEGDLPDLVVVDGGRGQLNVARAVLKDLGIDGVDVVSLAKSRVVGTDDSDGIVRSAERVFVVGQKDPVVLRKGSVELSILTRLRDEAHRFAVGFHRKRRAKARMRSRLDGLPGIGPKRRSALLKALGSMTRVEAASRDELAGVPGIGPRVGARLFAYLHATIPTDLGSASTLPDAGRNEADVDQDQADRGEVQSTKRAADQAEGVGLSQESDADLPSDEDS